MPANPNRKLRVKARPQQLTALKDRDAAAADAVRRYCPETPCVIELPPWAATHPGLHRRATLDTWRPDSGPLMWGRVGSPYRVGNLNEVRDAALGMIVAKYSAPEDIDLFEDTIRRLEQTRAALVGGR